MLHLEVSVLFINGSFLNEQIVRETFLAQSWQMILYTPPVLPLLSQGIGANKNDTNQSDGFGDTTHDLNLEAIEAAKTGNLDRIQSLVEGKHETKLGELIDQKYQWSPVKCCDSEGNTLLTWAAGSGHLQLCKYLVETCGMNPREAAGKKRRRRQPIHWSARNGHTWVSEWLVTYCGVDVDASTENGTTPLHFAIWMGHYDCVRWLVEYGHCDVNRRNGFGCNAAHWCGFKGDISMLEYMKLKGLDFFHINKNRRSALHKAAVRGNAEACQWLLTPESENGGGLGIEHMQPEIEGR